MRLIFLLLLTVLFSCAHHDGEYRRPSSTESKMIYGDVDPLKSSVKQFPPVYEDKFTRHFYFLEIKDENGKFVDRDIHEFEVRLKKKKLPAKIQRTLRGRYYAHFESEDDVVVGELDFFVGGMKLRESFKIGLLPAHRDNSSMRLLRKGKTRAKLELVLKDKKGRFVEVPDAPEIISEGGGELAKLEHKGNGIWHITLAYPHGNQLFYISVRSHGVYFKNLFRFQHVDN
jgi:hypothetical protein